MRSQCIRAILVALATAALVDTAVAAAEDAPDASAPPSAQSAPAEVLSDNAGAAVAARQPKGRGLAAMKKAAKAKKYLFALFRRAEDDQAAAMRTTLAAVIKKVTDRAESAEINVADPSEKPIVNRFRLDFAPMPLILAIAPNGAVTGGFPTHVETQDLLNAFATPCTEKCLKAFQDRKLAFLCIQNSKTKFSKEAMQGVREFARDERFAEDTEIIVIDPADAAEAGLLKDLQIDPKTKEAITVFFAPPGRRIGDFRGATSTDELVETLVAAMSGCGCGCAPR